MSHCNSARAWKRAVFRLQSFGPSGIWIGCSERVKPQRSLRGEPVFNIDQLIRMARSPFGGDCPESGAVSFYTAAPTAWIRSPLWSHSV